MVVIKVDLPNHEEHMRWISAKEVTGDKLHNIVRNLALEGESALKQILHTATRVSQRGVYPSLPPTGATAASIEAWPLQVSNEAVSYATGSRTRGHILRWLDLGRGYVYPKRARALWIKRGRVEPPIFRAFARPSPALHVMSRMMQMVMVKVEEIVERELR